MLDERKSTILRAIVREYIETAQPVGSAHVASDAGAAGLAGHRPQRDGRARAGGLPPPAAHLGRPGADRQGLPRSSSTTSPSPACSTTCGTQQVRDFFTSAHGALEQMLQHTTRLLVAAHQLRGGRHGVDAARWPRCARCSSSRLSDRDGDGRRRPVERHGRERHRSNGDRGAVRRRGRRRDRPPRPPRRRLHPGHARRGPAAVTRGRRRPGDRARAAGPARRCAAGPPTRTSTSTWAARPRWRRRSTPSTWCATCCSTLEQQYVVVSLLRDMLDRGCHRGHRHRARRRAAGRLLGGGGAVHRRGRAGRHHRRARPHPHELPAGPGRGRRRQPAPRRAPVATADGVPRRHGRLLRAARRPPGRLGRRDQAGLPAPGPRAAPRRQPGRSRTPRSSSRSCRRPTRCCPTRSSGRCYDRYGEAGAVAARRRGRATSSAGGRRARRPVRRLLRRRQPLRRRGVAARPARPAARTSRSSADLDLRAGRLRHHRCPSRSRTAVRCDDCDGERRRRPAPSRSRAPSAAAPARCGGSARACSARWSRPRPARAAAGSARSSSPRARRAAATAALIEDRTYQVDVPGRCRHRVDAAPHRAGRGRATRRARPATSTSTCGCARTSGSPATATTS